MIGKVLRRETQARREIKGVERVITLHGEQTVAPADIVINWEDLR